LRGFCFGHHCDTRTGCRQIEPNLWAPCVPYDIERKAPSDEYDIELAVWAWQQFVAVGWKATYDVGSLNFQSGTADTSWSLLDDTPDTVAWEIVAHRSELRL